MLWLAGAGALLTLGAEHAHAQSGPEPGASSSQEQAPSSGASEPERVTPPEASPATAVPGTLPAPREVMAEPAGSNAPALSTPSESRFGQRTFGLVAHVLPYAGFGGGVRAGLPWVGVLASAAWVPLLFYVRREFEYFSSAQINGELYVTFARAQARFAPGFNAGYKYNTLLQHGAATAFYAVVNLTRKLALQGQLGLALYPTGKRRVERRLNHCEENSADDCSLDFKFSPTVHFGASIGLLVFP